MVLLGTLFVVLSTCFTISYAAQLTDFFPRDGMCGLSTKERIDTLRRIQDIADRLQNDGVLVPQCGNGVWIPLTDFDVTGIDTECPPGWTFTDTPTRGCIGENSNGTGGCDLATFSTGDFPYHKVCGRITGRGNCFPLGFVDPTIFPAGALFDVNATLVDNIALVDGVTLSYSSPMQHIWTFAAAGTISIACPCNTPVIPALRTSPLEFAGDSYFCDLADSGGGKTLWAGDCGDLETVLPACCNFNNSPFFAAELGSTTTVNVDARLCLDGNGGTIPEGLLIESMELYVQ